MWNRARNWYLIVAAQCTFYPEAYLNCQAHIAVGMPQAYLCFCSHPWLCSSHTVPLFRILLGCSSVRTAVHILTLIQLCDTISRLWSPSAPSHCILSVGDSVSGSRDPLVSTAAYVLWLILINGTEFKHLLSRSSALLEGLCFAIHLTGDSWYMLCKYA